MFFHGDYESVAATTMMITDFCFGLDVPKHCFLAESTFSETKVVCHFFWQMADEAVWND